MNPQIDDDQMLLMSQYYPDEMYSHFAPPQDEVAVVSDQKPKARRRRKKIKSEAGVMKKRKLSDEQVTMLEESFGHEHKLESERKDKLAKELGLDPRQVAVWFQNRRARWKTKKLEEEYSQLKSEHDSTLFEKCRLESQIQKVKEQLVEAKKEIQRLSSERWEGLSSNSPTSSLSMDAMQQDQCFFGDYGVETGLESVFYMPQEQNYVNNGLGWDTSTIYYM